MQPFTRRPVWCSALLCAGTVLLGMVVRFGPTGLPWCIRKYGGSVLWAAMVYWVVSTVLGRSRSTVVALVAETAAVAVEFLKRVHTPMLEQWRGTLAGVLLLGREFSYADIVAYSVAIAGAALADAWLRRRLSAHAKRTAGCN